MALLPAVSARNSASEKVLKAVPMKVDPFVWPVDIQVKFIAIVI